jgi:ubiquitin-protein ligase
MWSFAQASRLAFERKLIARDMSHFSFYNPRGNTYISGWARTNPGRSYQVEITIPSDYPDEEPDLFVTSPRCLPMHAGIGTINALGTSAQYHTYDNNRGCVQICHTRYWDASMNCLVILIKAHFWLEAYEAHLRTGYPIADYLVEHY